MRNTILAVLYIALIAAANIIVAHVGPAASPYVAFAAVGVILTTRDRLQEAWEGRHLLLRIGGLIAAGGLLSYLLTPGVPIAPHIALASMVAFIASESIDTAIYTVLRHARADVKVNLSNAVSALVDSWVFLTIAFGSVTTSIVFTQFVAKVAGGALFLAALVAFGWWREARA